MTDKIMKRRQVEDAIGYKRSALYAMVSEGDFPKPIKLGRRAVGWLESDVSGWIKSRVNASRCAK